MEHRGELSSFTFYFYCGFEILKERMRAMQEKQDLFDKTTKQGRFYRSLFKIGILLAGILIAGGGFFGVGEKKSGGFWGGGGWDPRG